MEVSRVTGALAVALALALVALNGNAGDLTATDDATIVVLGEARHLATSNRTGTRTDIDPMELPQSISTVEPELLIRQGAQTLAEAMSNLAGVQDSGTAANLTMRGFIAGVMKNGVLNPSASHLFATPLIGIERIEVIKGPEAIIAGQSAGYGGVVNVITKVPQTKRVAEASLQLGEHGQQEWAANLAGALSEDRRITGRVVLASNTEHPDRLGYSGSRGDYVAPSVGYRDRTTGTEWVLGYERQSRALRNFWSVYFDPGSQSLDAASSPLRLGNNPGHALRVREENLTLDLIQSLANDWRLGVKIQRNVSEQNLGGGVFGLVLAYPQVAGITVDGTTQMQKDTIRLDLKGDAVTGPLRHQWLAAYDVERSTFRQSQPQPMQTDLYSAVDGRLLARLRSAGPSAVLAVQAPRESGLLLMDHITAGKWIGLGGIRHIRYEPGDRLAPGSETYSATLPSLGLLYRYTADLSLYANASQGFTANSGRIHFATKRQVEPEHARQQEIGVKRLLNDGKLALTAAVYRIVQKNYAASDTVNSTPTLRYFINVAGVESQGFDIELSGTLTDRLSIRAAYSNGTVQTPADQAAVPFARQQFGLSMSYALGGEARGGWLGFGVQGRDAARNFDSALGHEVTSPAVRRLDLNGGYSDRDWSLVAGVKNVTNRRNYTLESGPLGVGVVLQPREIFLSGRFRF